MSVNKKHRFSNDKLVEVWGDVVAIKELLVSITLSVALGMLAYWLAPANTTSQLLYSLTGIVLATIIISILFKPKRIIKVTEDNDQATESEVD